MNNDLLSARLLPDEILVLNHGRVVEQGPASRVIREPRDVYTRLLLDAIPKLEQIDSRSGYIPKEGEPIHVGASAIPERTA